MAIRCGVCKEADSKYKCPTCELRYCSLACYKPHKATHESAQPVPVPQQEQAQHPAPQPVPPPKHRPGTLSRTPKLDFTSLASDPEFQHLLTRYPTLLPQLQVLYGLTLDPGPDDARTWNRGPLPSLDRPQPSFARGRGRGGRGGRGGRSGRGSRGGGSGGMDVMEERQHGAWTKEKGDKEALLSLKTMREGKREDERAEGLREFGRLVGMRFGKGEDAMDEG